jgi:hypothetical protein
MGGGGLAPRHGASREVDMQGMTTSHTADDEQLPAYSELAPDEGIDMQEVDMPPYAPTLEPSWSFNHLGSSGAPHSQMTAVPPSSLDGDAADDFFTQEEDLFAAAADDNASTQAEGGDRSSVEMSDRDDDDFVDAPMLEVAEQQRGMRESAPPPPLVGDDDADGDVAELPVAEIRVPDVEED